MQIQQKLVKNLESIFPKIIFALLGILFFSSSAKADNDEVSPKEIDIVVKALKSSVIPVTTPFQVFHWEVPSGNFVDMPIKTPEDQLNYAKEQAKSYLATNAKYGFYAAPDPVLSADYGPLKSKNWRLIVVDIPAGTRLFGKGTLNPQPLDEQVRRMAKIRKDLGPLGDCLGAFFSYSMSGDFPENKCSKLKREAFARLHVDAMNYLYKEPDLSQWLKCPEESPDSFIFTDPKFFGPGMARVYTAETLPDAKNRREMGSIQKLNYMYGRGHLRKNKLWASGPLPGNVPDEMDPETNKWVHENIFNCLTKPDRPQESTQDENGFGPAK